MQRQQVARCAALKVAVVADSVEPEALAALGGELHRDGACADAHEAKPQRPLPAGGRREAPIEGAERVAESRRGAIRAFPTGRPDGRGLVEQAVKLGRVGREHLEGHGPELLGMAERAVEFRAPAWIEATL